MEGVELSTYFGAIENQKKKENVLSIFSHTMLQPEQPVELRRTSSMETCSKHCRQFHLVSLTSCLVTVMPVWGQDDLLMMYGIMCGVLTG